MLSLETEFFSNPWKIRIGLVLPSIDQSRCAQKFGFFYHLLVKIFRFNRKFSVPLSGTVIFASMANYETPELHEIVQRFYARNHSTHFHNNGIHLYFKSEKKITISHLPFGKIVFASIILVLFLFGFASETRIWLPSSVKKRNV